MGDTWQSELERITLEFEQYFGSLTDEELNFKPNATTWSIAQNLEHLILVNESYYPIIKAVRDKKYVLPWLGKFKKVTKFFGKLILNSVEATRKKRIKTFVIWDPAKSDIAAGIFSRFITHQQEFAEFITQCADLVENETVISSPANKNIVYRLETAFDIIVEHERRHLNQALEVLSVLKSEVVEN